MVAIIPPVSFVHTVGKTKECKVISGTSCAFQAGVKLIFTVYYYVHRKPLEGTGFTVDSAARVRHMILSSIVGCCPFFTDQREAEPLKNKIYSVLRLAL